MRLGAARLLATWFGCGLVPVAPGTFGTIGALPLYLVVSRGGSLAVLVAAACVALVGVWAAGAVSRHTGEHDPQYVVIDEVAGALLAFSTTGGDVRLVGLAFLSFRACDILKVAPARRAEALPGGWGIVADDLVAGTWSALLVGAVRIAAA